MGSKEIWNLKYRDNFAFIGVKGNKSQCSERRMAAGEKEASIV